MRPLSKVAPDWWDYTTLDREILDDAARLDRRGPARARRGPGFKVVFYDTLEDFYLAEALEYIAAWRQATAGRPGGHLRPDRPDRAAAAGGAAGQRAGPGSCATPISGAWTSGSIDGKEVPGRRTRCASRGPTWSCASTASGPSCGCRRRTCTSPPATWRRTRRAGTRSRCVVMQGGQGEVKHWAFNDPPRREGAYTDAPPSPAEYRKLDDPRRRPAPDDDHPERPHLRRRRGAARADPGGHRRPGGDLEGREGLDLAGRQPRQPVRHAADDADDLASGSPTRRCRCRCWPITRTCSSTSTGRDRATSAEMH